MNLTLRDATIAALSYADIFDYPLMENELRLWTPFVKRPRRSGALRKFVYRMTTGGDTYYSLRPTKRLIAIRNKRAAWSIDKWTRARRVANLLKYIPSIRLVGVTGGLTRANARVQDDIDFLIITAPKTLWVTRALSTVTFDLLRLRRRPGDTQFRNLICLNMFMSEDGLSVPRSERDLFTAHEVLLMTPLWERDGAYTKFLRANKWVKKFLPNAWGEKCRMPNVECRMKSRNKKENLFGIWHLAFCILEPVAQFIQLRYMNRRRSTEIVTDKVIRFHPRDARVWIKSALGRRLSRYKIPLDKIFSGR